MISKIRHFALLMLLGAGTTAHAALVEVFQDGAIFDIGDADAVIAATAPVASEVTTVINYNDGQNAGAVGYFGGDTLWPGDVKTDFAARITGTFGATAGDVMDFRIRHDDGTRLTINGSTVEFGGLTNDRDTFLNGLVLNAVNTIEIVFFEHGGGALLELSARVATAAAPGNWFLLQLDDGVPVPEPAPLLLLGAGLLGLVLRRRQI